MSGKKVPLWILDLQSDTCKKFHMPVQKIQLISGLADYQRTQNAAEMQVLLQFLADIRLNCRFLG